MRGVSDVMLMLGAVILSIAALWHAYWLVGGTAGLVRAVPEHDGAPVFVPGRIATAAAMCVIAMVAVLYAVAAGAAPSSNLASNLAPSLTPRLLAVSLAFAGIAFLLRAIGDFNHVGFFNRGGMTPFAVADRKVYSPLCLFLGSAGMVAAGFRFL